MTLLQIWLNYMQGRNTRYGRYGERCTTFFITQKLFLYFMEYSSLTVYCLNGANAPRCRGCLSATCDGKGAIKATGSIGLNPQFLDSNILICIQYYTLITFWEIGSILLVFQTFIVIMT